MSDTTFGQLVRGSRTYRRFAGTPVSHETLLELVDTARYAPSGNNLQVLRFGLVDDSPTVAAIAAHHGWAGLLRDFPGPAENELPGAYVAICAPKAQANNPIRLIDCGIAAQTICLAAHERGLGACMVKSFDKVAVAQFGLPEGYVPLLIIALGEPAADEMVVLESADTEHGVSYWRTEGNVQHVPKLAAEDLVL